jgi:hypothetical protein
MNPKLSPERLAVVQLFTFGNPLPRNWGTITRAVVVNMVSLSMPVSWALYPRRLSMKISVVRALAW